MGKPRRTLFQLLGWVVWKILSLLGVRWAKDKLEQDPHGSRRSRRSRGLLHRR